MAASSKQETKAVGKGNLVKTLPSAPPPPKFSMPNSSASASSTSEAQSRLAQLLTSLRSSKEALPAEVASMLGDQEILQNQLRSKALHQAVTAQDKAQTELLKILKPGEPT